LQTTGATGFSYCGTCPNPKPATWCSGCPRQEVTQENGYHFIDARITEPKDLVIVTEAPVLPRIAGINSMHLPFTDDAGRLINAAATDIRSTYPEFGQLNIGKTHAVLCAGQDPNKQTLDRCRGFLLAGLRTACTPSKTPVILAMGIGAVKALGIKAQSLKSVQSRVFNDVLIEDRKYTVVVTISTKQLVAMAGMYTTYHADLLRAFHLAREGYVQAAPLSELTKDYRYPKTVQEVRDLCEHIMQYAETARGKTAEQTSIALDTETNTLFPHRPGLKVLCVSVAWGEGKAAAIPLWHPETPYDPELAAPYVRALLECPKPKILHNAKFDFKVFQALGWRVENFKWDTMLMEHLLDEDKKGQYGLKEMTRTQFPAFADYADVLHAMLEKQEGDSQLDNIRKARKDAATDEKSELAATSEKKPGKKKRRGDDGGFEKVPLETLLPYAAIDTDMTRRIAVKQIDRAMREQEQLRIKREKGIKEIPRKYGVMDRSSDAHPLPLVLRTTTVPAVGTLSRMEFSGIRVDRPYLEKVQVDLEKVILSAQEDLYRMADIEGLKLNHAASIANVLFNVGFVHPETGKRTAYPAISTTRTGQLQTTEKVMQQLVARYDCPFSKKKLIYSKAYKAKNTFCKNVWDLSELDGYLHTNYNIHGTATGRLSSNDENMQNIPKKLGGYSIKKIFIPSDSSMAFVNADAKGAEVRIFTAYSRDAELIRSINDGMDTHAFFAAAIVKSVREAPDADDVLASMGLDPSTPLTYDDFNNREAIKQANKAYGDQLDKLRTAVKRVVFGILYGAGPRKIAETIGISLEQAQAIIKLLFGLFPSIPNYIEKTKWELNQFGCVETFFGRRRRFMMKNAPSSLRNRAERQSVNFKIQSTSSDIVIDCLAALEQPLARDLGGRLLLTVHDSIGFELPKKFLTQLPDFVKEHLENRPKKLYPWLPVTFKWDYEVGDSYGELAPLDVYLGKLKRVQDAKDEEAYTEEEVKTELATVE